jgi:hypothetical protein
MRRIITGLGAVGLAASSAGAQSGSGWVDVGRFVPDRTRAAVRLGPDQSQPREIRFCGAGAPGSMPGAGAGVSPASVRLRDVTVQYWSSATDRFFLTLSLFPLSVAAGSCTEPIAIGELPESILNSRIRYRATAMSVRYEQDSAGPEIVVGVR